jgi:hypothetical protein
MIMADKVARIMRLVDLWSLVSGVIMQLVYPANEVHDHDGKWVR